MKSTGMAYGIFGLVIGALLGAGITTALTAQSGEPHQTATSKTAHMADDETLVEDEEQSARLPEPQIVDLDPSDFNIKIKVREKHCFGSAGCNLTFQIDPKYTGYADLSEGSWDVTYKVTGASDGPVINTFTIENGQASFDEEEFVDTDGPEATVRAAVISVESVDY